MAPVAIDSARVIADLRELARQTSDEHGAQRLCWSPTWRRARALIGELLAEVGLEGTIDEAGNLWARLEGADPLAPALALGSHVDSVPNGGWLDGALGVMAAIGVLRSWSEADDPPPRPLVLIDWADEEGARFGRSLFGSSAFAGTLEPAELEALRDADGRPIAEVLAENGVELARAGECAARRQGLGAYVELHIEQGPVMEAEGLRVAAVTGCAGLERLRLTFVGQAAHAGTTPMAARHDAALAAAEAALAIEAIPEVEGGVATTGELRLEPGIPTAVAGKAVLAVDLRHPEAEPLARMLTAAVARCVGAGGRAGVRARGGARHDDRAGPLRRRSGVRRARRLRRGRRRAGEPRERRPARRRLGRRRAADRDAVRSLAGRDQPRARGGHGAGRPRGRNRGLLRARRPRPRRGRAGSGAGGRLSPLAACSYVLCRKYTSVLNIL